MWCHLFIGRYWNCDYEDSSQGRYKEWAETHFWKGKEEQLLKASKKAGRKDKRYSGTDVFTDTQIGKKLLKRAIKQLSVFRGINWNKELI